MFEVEAYAAGVIDSDGCIGLNLTSKGTYRININVTDSSGIIAEWMRSKFGGSVGNYRSSSFEASKNRLYTKWTASSNKSCVELSQRLLPYLVLKKEQARLIALFPLLERGRKSDVSINMKREYIRVQIRLLNAKYSNKEK